MIWPYKCIRNRLINNTLYRLQDKITKVKESYVFSKDVHVFDVIKAARVVFLDNVRSDVPGMTQHILFGKQNKSLSTQILHIDYI